MTIIRTVLVFDSMYLTSILLYITTPSRITSHTRPLIDNTFSNSVDNENSSRNITSTISDNYVQFFLTRKNKTEKRKKETYKHN